MTKVVKSSALVIAALWVDILFCLGFVVAPYLFILAARENPDVPNAGVAADLIGPLLYSSTSRVSSWGRVPVRTHLPSEAGRGKLWGHQYAQ